jgi:hypothetical protein
MTLQKLANYHRALFNVLPAFFFAPLRRQSEIFLAVRAPDQNQVGHGSVARQKD